MARRKATQTKVDISNLTPEQMEAAIAAQQGLSGALSKLMMVTENYPELKADKNFSDLMVALEGIENKIAVERRKYNKSAKAYNKYIKKFPNNLFISWNFLGIVGNDEDIEAMPYFQAEEGAKTAPKIEF